MDAATHQPPPGRPRFEPVRHLEHGPMKNARLLGRAATVTAVVAGSLVLADLRGR